MEYDAPVEDGRGTNDPAIASARRWTVRITEDGTPTLVHAVHGEACHSRSGAWQQARERYARGALLAARAQEGTLARLRLLDVGTGLGINVAAALEALAGTPVELVVDGLERDPEILARAAELLPLFPPHVRCWMEPVASAIGSALHAADPAAEIPLAGPGGTRGRLRLHLGDASASIGRFPESARFDAVFLDPFSPRVEAASWEPGFLAAIAARMAPHSRLVTYSVSLAVRAALSAAGLRVGAGPAVGAKRGGTIASPEMDLPPLDPRTARRVARRARELCHAP